MNIHRLREELLGNPRLRWGLALIAALLVLYAILLLRDAGRNARATAASPQARIAALVGSVGEAELWRARVERSRGLLAEYDGYVWRDATLAQAQAALQDLLTQKLSGAGLRASEFNVGGGIDAPGAAPQVAAAGANAELVKIRARVVFEYQRPALAMFVRGLQDGPRHVGLDRLLIRTTAAPMAEIEMFALYRPPSSTGR